MRKIKSSKSEELLTMSQIVGLFVNAGISKSLKLQICWPEENKAVYTSQSRVRVGGSGEKAKKAKWDRPTDGRTDGPTDGQSES